jgi:predicted dehydrogenase
MHTAAVVGCGYWGPNLIRNLETLPEVRVKWMCDARGDRLTHLKALYPAVEATRLSSDILDDPEVDLVAIATPVRTHHELARASLMAGKHTFVEKPLAFSEAECLDLIRIAEDRSLTLMVGHTFIYTSTVRKIKEIVGSKAIGDVIYISCRRLNLGLFQKDINVAWDLAPHDLSIILFIMDHRPTAVNCQGKAHVTPGVEDVTNICLTFPNGGFATIHSSWIDPRKVREITIVGTKKMIVYDDTESLEQIRIYDKRVEPPPHYDTFGDFHYSYHYGDILSPYVRMIEPLKVECQHFLDCIGSGTTPDSSGYDGLDVVRILEAASVSLRTGGSMVTLGGRARRQEVRI